MGLLDLITEERIRFAWNVVKKQAWGFILGIVLTCIIVYFFIYPAYSSYKNKGEKIGYYKIALGESALVIQGEILIRFNKFKYRKNDGDSDFVFPSFQLYTKKTDIYGGTFDNMHLEEPIYVPIESYLYSIELNSISINKQDTFALLEIHRRPR